MILLGTERVIEIDGVKFTVRPETYQDVFKASDKAAKMSLDMGIEDNRYSGIIAMNLTIVDRIVSWEGVGVSENEPAPCTYENKLTFFAQNREFVGKILRALSEGEADDRKNSGPSDGG